MRGINIKDVAINATTLGGINAERFGYVRNISNWHSGERISVREFVSYIRNEFIKIHANSGLMHLILTASHAWGNVPVIESNFGDINLSGGIIDIKAYNQNIFTIEVSIVNEVGGFLNPRAGNKLIISVRSWSDSEREEINTILVASQEENIIQNTNDMEISNLQMGGGMTHFAIGEYAVTVRQKGGQHERSKHSKLSEVRSCNPNPLTDDIFRRPHVREYRLHIGKWIVPDNGRKRGNISTWVKWCGYSDGLFPRLAGKSNILSGLYREGNKYIYKDLVARSVVPLEKINDRSSLDYVRKEVVAA